MKKLTKAILTFVLFVTVVSSVASLPKYGTKPSNGEISTLAFEDWGWIHTTR